MIILCKCFRFRPYHRVVHIMHRSSSASVLVEMVCGVEMVEMVRFIGFADRRSTDRHYVLCLTVNGQTGACRRPDETESSHRARTMDDDDDDDDAAPLAAMVGVACSCRHSHCN